MLLKQTFITQQPFWVPGEQKALFLLVQPCTGWKSFVSALRDKGLLLIKPQHYTEKCVGYSYLQIKYPGKKQKYQDQCCDPSKWEMWHCGVQKLLVSLSKRIIECNIKNARTWIYHKYMYTVQLNSYQRIKKNFQWYCLLINGKNQRKEDPLHWSFQMFWWYSVGVGSWKSSQLWQVRDRKAKSYSEPS